MARRAPQGLHGLFTITALVLLAGCMPLFVPPVPDSLPAIEPRLRLSDVMLVRLEGEPGVRFDVSEVPTEGWLAFQWFPPAGGEVASSSVWLSPDEVGRSLWSPVPTRTGERKAGRWRVVVSWQGEFVRQLEWIEPAGS